MACKAYATRTRTDVLVLRSRVDRVTEVMVEIALASEQQADGVAQINTAAERMNTITQQVAASAVTTSTTRSGRSHRSHRSIRGPACEHLGRGTSCEAGSGSVVHPKRNS